VKALHGGGGSASFSIGLNQFDKSNEGAMTAAVHQHATLTQAEMEFSWLFFDLEWIASTSD
jgi:hypothetical protein